MDNATITQLKSQLKSNLPQKYIHVLQALLTVPRILEKYNTQSMLRAAPDKASYRYQYTGSTSDEIFISFASGIWI